METCVNIGKKEGHIKIYISVEPGIDSDIVVGRQRSNAANPDSITTL